MARETLTRDQIVHAAIQLLDAEGLEGLSMRRLGERLGSAATAVYWHVKNKDDLVSLAGDEVWSQVTLPDPDEVGWRDAVSAMAHSTHAMLTRHPWLVAAMSSQTIYGPGKARFDDHGIAVFEAAGFADPDLDAAMGTIFTFVLGTALSESTEAAWRRRLRRDGGDETAEIQALFARVTEIGMQYPRLRARLEAMGDADPAAPPSDSFAFGLTAILDGLEARLQR